MVGLFAFEIYFLLVAVEVGVEVVDETVVEVAVEVVDVVVVVVAIPLI